MVSTNADRLDGSTDQNARQRYNQCNEWLGVLLACCTLVPSSGVGGCSLGGAGCAADFSDEGDGAGVDVNLDLVARSAHGDLRAGHGWRGGADLSVVIGGGERNGLDTGRGDDGGRNVCVRVVIVPARQRNLGDKNGIDAAVG